MAAPDAPQVRFSVTYDGPAVAGGRLPAKDLGLALYSVAQMVERASALTLPGESQVALEVEAEFREGSFAVDVAIVSWVAEQLSAIGVDNLKWIFSALFGTGGVFKLYQMVKNRKPDKVEPTAQGQIAFHFGDEVTNVNITVVNLALDEEIHESVKGLVGPVHQPGVDTLRIEAPGEEPAVVDKGNVDYYMSRIEPPGEEETRVSTVLLKILTISFEQGHKWRFAQGEVVFWARIVDEDFTKRVDRARENFSKGDVLRAELEVTTTFVPGQDPEFERTVLRVLRHYRAGSTFQGNLDDQ